MNKMKKMNIKPGTQSGFTLIELIVVIVILGVLAATALPKFADLGGDARLAKMQAAAGAVRSAAAMTHGSWMAAGAPTATDLNSTRTNSVLTAEGLRVPFRNGYPDVGGDGATNAAMVAANSGIVVSAGGLADYNMVATPATPTVLTVRPDADASRANCFFTYAEPANATAAPVVNTSRLTLANCN
jgi:MSHA pilin protein MshA